LLFALGVGSHCCATTRPTIRLQGTGGASGATRSGHRFDRCRRGTACGPRQALRSEAFRTIRTNLSHTTSTTRPLSSRHCRCPARARHGCLQLAITMAQAGLRGLPRRGRCGAPASPNTWDRFRCRSDRCGWQDHAGSGVAALEPVLLRCCPARSRPTAGLLARVR
jgi:hypothetical protein